jgi:long-chain fatty acid transport protein
MPAFALVRRDLGDLTFGIGFASVAGFRSDYPVDPTNPILSPQPPAGIGLGRVLGSADIFQLTPAVSYQVTERWSFGFAPILTIAKIEVNPLVFASPAATGAYPTGTDPDYRYGGGFQLGAYHEGESGFNYGFAFKSPQWIETFNVNATDASGAPREESYQMDLPMIASIGASYTGLQDWLFALDVRYTDYSSVNGFAESGYNAQGAVKGLGWDSIFSVSPGIQYMPTEKLALRIGYTYMENPIPDSQAMFNVASPLMYQHILGVGMSYELGCDTTFSVAYLHGFENSVSGPIVNPVLGDLPGTEVENESSADAIAVALTFEY